MERDIKINYGKNDANHLENIYKDCLFNDAETNSKINNRLVLANGLSLQFIDKNKTYEHTFDDGDICIIYCKEGRYECEINNQEVFYLNNGYYLISTAKSLPKSYFIPMENAKAINLTINIKTLSSYAMEVLKRNNVDIIEFSKRLKLNNSVYLSNANLNEGLKAVFDELSNDNCDIEYYKNKALESLYYINFCAFLDTNVFKTFARDDIQIIKNIHDELLAHLSQKLSLDYLGKKYGINLSLLHKLFLQVYGKTPYAYLKDYKMHVAAEALKDGKQKINEVAKELGYHNASKFTTAFESVFGMLPKDYRKISK